MCARHMRMHMHRRMRMHMHMHMHMGAGEVPFDAVASDLILSYLGEVPLSTPSQLAAGSAAAIAAWAGTRCSKSMSREGQNVRKKNYLINRKISASAVGWDKKFKIV